MHLQIDRVGEMVSIKKGEEKSDPNLKIRGVHVSAAIGQMVEAMAYATVMGLSLSLF